MPNLQPRVISLALVFALIAGLFALSSRSTAQGAVGAAMPGPTGATGVFVPHPVTPAFGSNNSWDLALGDLDRDGDLDAVVANGTTEPETVWLNNGQGRFTAHSTPSFGARDSRGVTLGDLDADGDLDAVVANFGTPSETVWLNNGVGVFSPHPQQPSFGTGDGQQVGLGDLDGDGDLDAVVTNWNNQPQTVWLNNGMGVFTAHPTTPTLGVGMSGGVALGDLDGDGDRDVVIANWSNQPETVWINNGAGGFAAHSVMPTFGAGDSTDVNLGDLDGDGDLDAVVANWTNQPETVWVNNGSGVFTPHPTLPSFGAGTSQDVNLGDLDGDGDLDAVIANIDNAPETVWLNDGTGRFLAHPTAPGFGASQSEEVGLGDLDGDGDLDAVVANYTSQAETVWLNRNASVLVQPTQLLTTTEAGGTATFGMRLGFAPTANVTIGLSTSDPTEGYLTVNQVVFTPSTWAITQTITVTGLDDGILDGDIPYTITTSLASSSDPAYSGQNVADVRLVNLDNEIAPTATATSTATALPSQTPTAGKSLAFMPLLMRIAAWSVAINPQAIATRPVVTAGEIYYTTTLTIGAPLPVAGHFYLSSAPDRLAPVMVDDELAVLVGDPLVGVDEQWSAFLTYPKVVEVPRSLIEQWAGQPITVIFRDAHASVVGSSPVWLVWTP